MKRVGNKKKIQKIYQLHFVPIFIFYRCISFLLKIGIFFSPIFHFFQTKGAFTPDTCLFPHMTFKSLGYIMKHTAGFVSEQYFLRWGKREGVWEKVSFVGKKGTRLGKKMHHAKANHH